MFSHLKTTLLATTLLGLWAASAAAVPAQVTTNTALRHGPGTNYSIQVVIPAGATIDVEGCGGNWCSATWSRYRGYVPRAVVALLEDEEGPAVAVAPDVYDEDYSYGPVYGYGYGIYDPGYRHYHRGVRPHVRTEEPRRQHHRQWQGGGGIGTRGNYQPSPQPGLRQIQPSYRSQTPSVQVQPRAGAPAAAKPNGQIPSGGGTSTGGR